MEIDVPPVSKGRSSFRGEQHFANGSHPNSNNNSQEPTPRVTRSHAGSISPSNAPISTKSASGSRHGSLTRPVPMGGVGAPGPSGPVYLAARGRPSQDGSTGSEYGGDEDEEKVLALFDENGDFIHFKKEPETIDPFEEMKTLYKGHTDAVMAMVLDQVDQRLYTASWDNNVIIWSVFTRDRIGVLPHGAWVNDIQIVRLHPDPRETAKSPFRGGSTSPARKSTTSPGLEPSLAAKLHHRTSGSSAASVGGANNTSTVQFDATVNSMTLNTTQAMSGIFSTASQDFNSLPKTKFIVTACEDGNVTLWDPSEMNVVFQIAPSFGAVTSLTVSNDMIFAASLGSIYAISLVSGTVVREYSERSDVNCLVTYEDQIFCGLQDGRLLCWDIIGAFVLREMKGHGPDGGVRDMLIHVPQNAIYSCGDDGRVKIWTLSTGTCLHAIRISTKPIRSLALHVGGSAPERFLYVGGFDGLLRILRLSNMQFRTVNSFIADCMTVYDDGVTAHLIAGDHSGVVQSFPLKAVEDRANRLYV